MLWVLKRTVSLRRFFRAPKTNVKTDGVRKYLKFYAEKKPVKKILFISFLVIYIFVVAPIHYSKTIICILLMKSLYYLLIKLYRMKMLIFNGFGVPKIILLNIKNLCLNPYLLKSTVKFKIYWL